MDGSDVYTNMAASIRFFGLRTFQHCLKKSFNYRQTYAQTRNIYLCLQNILPDRIGSLSANQYAMKWDFAKTKKYSSSSNHSGHVLTSSSTSDDLNQVMTGKENIKDGDEEADCLYSKIVIEVKGHDPQVINSYERFVSMAADGLDVQIANIFTPPKVITRYTLLKSVHIFKKHRVQYENRTHYRVIEFVHLTGSTADTILEYIQRNLPEGMSMKVTRHRLEKLPQHIQREIDNKQH